jgi:phosphatidylinositol alpha 1,6-mannosyltransferase
MSGEPRVAFFCETFHEVNGVALTARQLVEFARRQGRAFLAFQPGRHCARYEEDSVTRVELPRSFASFGIERDLRYDLFFWRHANYVWSALVKFRPDVVHVTCPAEFGQLGAYLAHKMGVPLVASWHTNLHQFGARRLRKLVGFLPDDAAQRAHDWAERTALLPLIRFYRIARATLAPTPEQVRWLEERTGKPCFLMPRGVDCEEFHPKHRDAHDGRLRLGFVGRVTPEKNVRLLAQIEDALVAAGHKDFSIFVIGQGSEREWLQGRLRHGILPGVLRGRELAQAYANMDLLVFPSRTDTYGNVVQEAAASGVAAVVTNEGGPKYLVSHGVTGMIADRDEEFVRCTVELVANRERLRRMGVAARERVDGTSWDTAFEMTYAAYRFCKRGRETARTGPGEPLALCAQAPAR